MARTDLFNPLLASGIQKVTTPGYKVFQTVAAARLGDATGVESQVCYIEEKEAFYNFCLNCGLPDDGDLVLTTATGGDSRWELVQKVSRTQGDNGWIDRDGLTLSKLNTTTLRATLTSKAYYAVNSKRITLPAGNYDISFTGTARRIAVYFNASGTLSQSDNIDTLFTSTPAAVVYWTGTQIGGIQTEFHGIRDSVWHAWAHKYLGTQYDSGLQITTNTQPDTVNDPGTDDVQYLWLTTGTIYDEDTAITIGTGNWTQTLGSGLTSTTAAVIPFFYYNATAGAVIGVAANADRYPFLYTGANGYPQWENNGVRTDAVSGDYVVYHYFASPFIDGYSVFARPHNAKFATLVAAQAARPASLTWSAIGEWKHLYSVVFRCGNWSPVPAHNCKIVSVQDFRNVSSGPASGVNASAHGALSGLADFGAHPATAIATDITNFDKNLSASNTSLQSVADAFDEFDSLPNNSTNASASPDLHNKAAFASANDSQTATFTFDARGAIEFLLDVNTDGGMTIACDYKSTTINALSDPSELFLDSDAGTGIYISKSANSAVVSVKNRMGGAKTIGVLAVRSKITAATAWS